MTEQMTDPHEHEYEFTITVRATGRHAGLALKKVERMVHTSFAVASVKSIQPEPSTR